MVNSPIDLLGSSVFLQQSSEDSLSPHPKDLGWHSAFPCTSSFTGSRVPSESLGFEMLSSTGSRMHFLLSLHDETILNQLSDEDSAVGLTDLLNLAGIHPDSLASALQNL